MPAILVAGPGGLPVLPLNTEKAHNLKEKALEVIACTAARWASSRVDGGDWAFQFESAHLITLGLLYEQNSDLPAAPSRRSCAASKVPQVGLRKASRAEERARWSARRRDAGHRRRQVKKRGINHPYVKTTCSRGRRR